MTKKGIFLVSLNSKRLEDFLKNKEESKLNNGLDKLDVFVFDIFETLNGLFFNDKGISKQNELMENVISDVNKEIVETNSADRQLIRFTQIQKELSSYMEAVYREYFLNASFKRHCKSQIFQNLQPKLRDVEITNHKSDLLELIAPFLLAEIAFYLYAYDKAEYEVIYGLESEMNIIEDIKKNKYPVFSQFMKKDIPHKKIAVN